ncbi:MAG TPA: sialidase family protein [Candidatus Bathyarchaeia archaeon]|nr:sialidase family protein [Candidatus Bathyarchaeia archaeon]
MRSALVAVAVLAITLVAPSLSSAGNNVRLTHDDNTLDYVSLYTQNTGTPYDDPTLQECRVSHGRQNEPSVAIDPRNSSVILGSSNDYCGVYQPAGATIQSAIGPIWLGYYRSENGGSTFRSTLVPGYPDDTSPYAALANIRTASSGDPVIAWDNHGNAYFGSESSDDPAGTKKTFGDVWVARFDNPDPAQATINDGKRFRYSEVVAHGSSAPNLLGKFNDKTAIEADRSGSSCDGNVYFAYSRFTGNGGVAIYFSRSTDQGATWSAPKKLSSASDVQFPDISVTSNGHVYVTWRTFMAKKHDTDSVQITKSVDCGATFAPPTTIATFVPNDAVDIADPQAIPPQSARDDPLGEDATAASGSLARDCGDFGDHCLSGYTFFRRDTQVRSTADQKSSDEIVYLVFDATKDGIQVPTGTSYGTNSPGTAGQAATYFFRYNGATGAAMAPAIIDREAAGHQVFPDISVDGGVLFAIWWDSRSDPQYSIMRPIGNGPTRATTASLDVYWSTSTNRGTTWSPGTILTTVRSNPNYEQFDNRAVPFAGDYLWVSNIGSTAYAVWTDWRDTVPGLDPREGATVDSDADAADVLQCRVFTTAWSGDRCPHDGGIDQNIYGSVIP